jgi:urease accessory protein
MTNLHSDRHLSALFVSEALGLKPEIMRAGGCCDKDKAERGNSIFHGCSNASSPERLRVRTIGPKSLLAMAALMGTTPALAHEGTGLAGGFLSGFIHPFTGADHMLAMISVGLWGAFLGRPLLLLLPMIFPTMMACGAALGMAGVPVPPVEIGIAISVLILGTLILFAARLPVPLACTVVAIFALFHGYAHGVELPSAADPVGYSAGFVLATGLLHLLGIALGSVKTLPSGTIILRTGGGVIGVIGVYFLVTALGR